MLALQAHVKGIAERHKSAVSVLQQPELASSCRAHDPWKPAAVLHCPGELQVHCAALLAALSGTHQLGCWTQMLGCDTQHHPGGGALVPSPPVCPCLQAEAGFVFHHANTYVEDGRIIVDCVRYPRLPDFKGCRSDGPTFVQVSAQALQCKAGLPCDPALALSRLKQTAATQFFPPLALALTPVADEQAELSKLLSSSASLCIVECGAGCSAHQPAVALRSAPWQWAGGGQAALSEGTGVPQCQPRLHRWGAYSSCTPASPQLATF